jgi:hypothetical protein
MLFGKQWMKEMGRNPESMKGMAFPVKPMAVQFIASLVLAYVVALFSFALDAITVSDAVTLAGWLWLGFYVTSQLNAVLWEGRSWRLYFINITQSLVHACSHGHRNRPLALRLSERKNDTLVSLRVTRRCRS